MSKLLVRQADLDVDRMPLIEVLSRNLTDVDHQKRFAWLYLENPAGPGRAWLLCDETPTRVVGSASVFPKYVWIGSELHRCGQVGDFAVDIAYRSLGPAVQLQKATLIPVNEGDLTFCYDCPPHDRGMAPFRRLGLPAACRMARYVKPLSVDAIVQNLVPGGVWIQRPLALVLNGILRVRDVNTRRARGLTMQAHPEPFGEEFTDLDRREFPAPGTVRSRRFAEDLNWRYLRAPGDRYQVVTARRGGELQGYAVYQLHGNRVFLIEVSTPVRSVLAPLLEWVTGTARSLGGTMIESMAVHSSSEARSLACSGFRFRELAQRVVPYFQNDFKPVERIWQFSALELLA